MIMKGRIHSKETFGLVDGPGVRYVLFLHGCPFRCQFCHNPDTWGSENYEEKTPQAIIEDVLRYKTYWMTRGGGLTVSGGEPLMQMDFMLELFREAKKKGVNTCIDTSAACFTREGEWFEKFEKLMEDTDLLMVDIKEMNPERHKTITGTGNSQVLDMLKYLDEIHKPVWIRHVLVPQRSDYDEDLEAMRDFINTLSNVEKVEVLPYHTYGVYKWEELGLKYPLEGIEPPTDERVANANRILETDKYKPAVNIPE